MHLVASHTRNRRLILHARIDLPRSLPVHGRYQVADAPGEVRAMTTHAIVHQKLLAVVLTFMRGIEEDLCIAHTVRTRLPVGELLTVASLAALQHRR